MARERNKGNKMAGTKEKPCELCKYGDFKAAMEKFRKEEIDVCFLCNRASRWKQIGKENETAIRGIDKFKEGLDG